MVDTYNHLSIVFEQSGVHLGFTQSVMTASTLLPIFVVRTDA